LGLAVLTGDGVQLFDRVIGQLQAAASRRSKAALKITVKSVIFQLFDCTIPVVGQDF